MCPHDSKRLLLKILYDFELSLLDYMNQKLQLLIAHNNNHMTD